MSARKTERLLNLVICLLSTRQYLTKAQIRGAVPQYDECRTTEAFERQFERDKDELREMGVPLVTGSHDAWFDDELGYRIDREAYAVPEVSFAPDELAVLGLASRVWQQASLAGAASRALLKLKADGVEPDETSMVGIEPRIRASEPAFEPLYAATVARRAVRFPYRAARGADLTQRHVEPWGIASWHGRWYLVGHDLDRGATRVFRLSRVAGRVVAEGDPGTVVVPAGLDLRAELARLAGDPVTSLARIRVRAGRGGNLRRRATEVVPGDSADGEAGTAGTGGKAGPDGPDSPDSPDSIAGTAGAPPGWDVVVVAFGDAEVLAQEVTGLGPDAVALAPAEVREAVVRRVRAVLAACDPASATATATAPATATATAPAPASAGQP